MTIEQLRKENEKLKEQLRRQQFKECKLCLGTGILKTTSNGYEIVCHLCKGDGWHY